MHSSWSGRARSRLGGVARGARLRNSLDVKTTARRRTAGPAERGRQEPSDEGRACSRPCGPIRSDPR
ncbi:hypothetical protein FM110_06550 [Brachybacterium nesterenkovii]|uniref:Uncharacterized protein n=1 Tax=Brachybacterium nesterenkovii TaxID=47847 RepID=A0A1X6WZR3_9MICO|nr:hypothetical protein FM110_06550 [Brachybacterium nesterenkovii]